MSALRLTPTVFEGYRMVSSLPRSMFSRWTSNPSGARISSCCAMPFDPTMKKIENLSNPFFMICPGIEKLVLTDLFKIWIIVKMTQTTFHFYTIIFQGDQYILEFALVRATNPRKSALYRVLPHAAPVLIYESGLEDRKGFRGKHSGLYSRQDRQHASLGYDGYT